MSSIYENYAVNGKLTRAEMTKYNRYASMERNIFTQMDDATRANISTIKRMLPEQYNEAFFNYAWAMDNANGVRLNYGVINLSAVKENLANPWLNNALEKYRLAGKTQIRAALNEGLTLGKAYTTMAKNLRGAIGRLQYEALRIVRTEGQTAVNAAQADLYAKAKSAGINGNDIWDATLDGRTRETHRLMDGVKKSEDGYFHGAIGKAPYPVWEGLSASERIQCRCRIRFEVESYAPTIRRSRDQGIIPYQTYPEWEKKYKPKVKR